MTSVRAWESGHPRPGRLVLRPRQGMFTLVPFYGAKNSDTPHSEPPEWRPKRWHDRLLRALCTLAVFPLSVRGQDVLSGLWGDSSLLILLLHSAISGRVLFLGEAFSYIWGGGAASNCYQSSDSPVLSFSKLILLYDDLFPALIVFSRPSY